MFVVVAYDVNTERTELYRKMLSQHLLHAQYSVFLGDITEAHFRTLSQKMKGLLQGTDHLLIISVENRHNVRIEHWDQSGHHSDDSHRGSMVL